MCVNQYEQVNADGLVGITGGLSRNHNSCKMTFSVLKYLLPEMMMMASVEES